MDHNDRIALTIGRLVIENAQIASDRDALARERDQLRQALEASNAPQAADDASAA